MDGTSHLAPVICETKSCRALGAKLQSCLQERQLTEAMTTSKEAKAAYEKFMSQAKDADAAYKKALAEKERKVSSRNSYQIFLLLSLQ